MKKLLVFNILLTYSFIAKSQFKGGGGDGFAGIPTYSQPNVTVFFGGQNDGFATAFYSQVGAPLPITLISFTGKKINQINVLNWQTTHEINASHFDIERSPLPLGGGILMGKFEKIGQLITNESKKYEFQDHNSPSGPFDPSSGGLYRLKLIDLDGKYNYSKIISIANDIENETVGAFYPNPAVNSHTNIDIVTQQQEEWIISQFDISGQLLNTEKRVLKKGINKIVIQNPDAGLHIFGFQNSKNVFFRKLLK